MKKFTRFVCMILVLSVFLAVPAYAEVAGGTRESAFFASYGASLEKTGTKTFKIWFDVDANAATMQELGVSEIAIYRSADQQTWSLMRTYRKGPYPAMIAYNTGSHAGYMTYENATTGYYYTARVTFYAKNSTGIGERDVYTQIIKM